MRAPAFWWREKPSSAARLLAPAGAVYGAVTANRMARAGVRAAVPVLCVGNPVVGGAGKTPVALAITELLLAAGHDPAFLSRGYGRTRIETGDPPFRVEPGRHDAETCGDEPLLLAQVAPTYVSADRPASAALAIANGASVLVLDDGLQNPTLAKDFSVAVVDGAAGVGNGLCLPAGPLRAPLTRQWPHIALLLVVGAGTAGERVVAAAENAGIPIARADLEPDPSALAALGRRPLLAFAGIGRPEKFFATLQNAGLNLVERRSFPDHHVFTGDDLASLRRAAEHAGASLITTTKDRVRLPPGFDTAVLEVRLVFDDPDAMIERLAMLFE